MKVIWKLPDGSEISAQVSDGTNMMEAAVANNVPNVIGECGGSLACATCHVYVDAAWSSQTGAAGEFEDAMLDATEASADQHPASPARYWRHRYWMVSL